MAFSSIQEIYLKTKLKTSKNYIDYGIQQYARDLILGINCQIKSIRSKKENNNSNRNLRSNNNRRTNFCNNSKRQKTKRREQKMPKRHKRNRRRNRESRQFNRKKMYKDAIIHWIRRYIVI